MNSIALLRGLHDCAANQQNIEAQAKKFRRIRRYEPSPM